MMSFGRYLENKGKMLQGGGGEESALWELHTSGRLFHEKSRKDWRVVSSSRGGSIVEIILERWRWEWEGETEVDCRLSCPSIPQGEGRHGGVLVALLGRHPQAATELAWSKPSNVCMYVVNLHKSPTPRQPGR